LADQQRFSIRHKHYLKREPIWKWNRDHFMGANALLSSKDDGVISDVDYLPKFQIEEDAPYQKRVKRARGLYDNLVSRALKVYRSQVHRVPPVRNISGDAEVALLDIDGFGTPAEQFFQNHNELSWLYGIQSCLVVGPPDVDGRLSQGQVSVAEAQARKLRPWVESIPPLTMVDWGIETTDPARRGELNYVMLRDEVMGEKEPMKKPTRYDRYRIYTMTETQTFRIVLEAGDDMSEVVVDVIEDDPIQHGLGEVPIVPFYDQFVAPMQGATVMDDVAESANALWNSWSVADQAYYYQGFNIMVLFTDKDSKKIKIAEDRGLVLDPGDKAEYLAPSPVPFDAHRLRVEMIRERVRDVVFNRTDRQNPTAQVESAEKRELDREEFVALLEQKSGNAERAERKVWSLLSKAWGQENVEHEITYNRRFRTDARAADEWTKLTEAGVYSMAEWYMDEHPEADSEDQAWKKMAENIKMNEAMSPARRAEDRMRESVVAAAGNGIEDEEAPEAEESSASNVNTGEGALPPKEVLNGAQVASIVDVVKQVKAGTISYQSGLQLLFIAFGLEEEEARKLLGPEDEADEARDAAPTPPPAVAPVSAAQ
jgi:hypothetical protein